MSTHRVADARRDRVELRRDAQVSHRAAVVGRPAVRRRIDGDDDGAVRLQFVRLFAAEEARRQRERVDELRGRNREASRHERKERPLIDERVEAGEPT